MVMESERAAVPNLNNLWHERRDEIDRIISTVHVAYMAAAAVSPQEDMNALSGLMKAIEHDLCRFADEVLPPEGGQADV